MNYHKYYSVDVVNGPGTRCTLFVSGCEHMCKGCYNKSTWSLNSGILYDKQVEDRIIKDLNDELIPRQGLSLSGGDPLNPENVDTILSLVKRVKLECKNKNIWVWTGYTFEDLSEKQKEVLEYIDFVVDGKFVEAQKDLSLLWRGSSNQRIIDVKKPL